MHLGASSLDALGVATMCLFTCFCGYSWDMRRLGACVRSNARMSWSLQLPSDRDAGIRWTRQDHLDRLCRLQPEFVDAVDFFHGCN